MMTQLDPHLHTNYSGDAIISPKLVVEQLYAHPFIKPCLEPGQFAPEAFGFWFAHVAEESCPVDISGVDVDDAEGVVLGHSHGINRAPPSAGCSTI